MIKTFFIMMFLSYRCIKYSSILYILPLIMITICLHSCKMILDVLDILGYNRNKGEMMKFTELPIDGNLQTALKKLNYIDVLPVQEQVFFPLLKKEDVLVKSQTGSGKTAAYALPVLQSVTWEENRPQCLILVPTRELALQVRDECNAIGVYKRVKTYAVFGKQPMKTQIMDLKQKTHVIAGTPGRVLDHLQRGTLDISKVEYVILDEADEMLSMGFLDKVQKILSYVPEYAALCMFSATLPEEIQQLADTYLRDPIYIDMQPSRLINEQIEHYAYRIKECEKPDFLWKLLLTEQPSSAILFFRTQERVEEAFDVLQKHGLCIGKLHGGMLQQERIDQIRAFKEGRRRFLVATDVAARGIDIDAVSHVINVDFPLEKESYVHRIGRTARKDRTGKAISLITHSDELRVKETERYIGNPVRIKERLDIDHLVIDDSSVRELRRRPQIKRLKDHEIKQEITKLYINGGKKKKLRVGDFVGAICEIEGVKAGDIGIIQIKDHVSYVQILNGKGCFVMDGLRQKTIKGKKLRVEIAKE
jgi:ATP-dependent RNA helicase DeaD